MYIYRYSPHVTCASKGCSYSGCFKLFHFSLERISDDILRKAISEGSGYLKPSVVIMHGPPGAGKSSVKDLILGRPPRKPEEQNSTGK